MKFKLIYLILPLLLLGTKGNAGNNLINTADAILSGQVIAATGEPMPGVSVVIKGTSTGTITDDNGVFELKSSAQSGTLIFSFVGYKPHEENFKGSAALKITLEAAAGMLDEAVVIGYGTAKKGNIANAVSSISSEDLDDRPLNRIENAFSGQLAGVYAQTVNGEPGAEMQIRVRGTGSINASNEPLYVVDGVPVDNLRGINPTDVQTIDILKDAAAAAIYGSRGSNGVVLVTTKKGKKGKPRLTYSGYIGMQRLESKIDMLSAEDWIQMRKESIDEAWVARGQTLNPKKDYKATDSQEFRAAELGVSPWATPSLSIANLIYDPKWAYGQDSLQYIDWQKEMFRDAMMKYNELGVSGGSDDMSYNIRASYLDQDGIAVGTNLKRVNLRANFETKIANRFKFGVMLAPSVEWSNTGRVDGKDNTAMVAIQMPPVVDKAYGKYTGAMPYPSYAWSGRYQNPIANMERSVFDARRYRLNSNAYLNVDIVSGLQAQFMAGMDFNYYTDLRFTPTSALRDWATTVEGAATTAARNQNWNNRYLFQSVLSYNKSFNKTHNVNVIAGYSIETTQFEASGQTASGFANDWSPIFSTSSVKTIGSSISAGKTGLVSYFGRAGYDYKGKYIVSTSLRQDGSSKFGSNKRWGIFPAVSGAWRISEEKFLKNNNIVSDLKLRGSWGVTGNNRIPDNAQFSLLGNQNYPFNNVSVAGFSPVTIENLDLGWEQTQSTNFGLDFGLFKNRILVSVDRYRRLTNNLLLQAPVSATSGFSTSWQNVGDIENKGYELTLTSRNIVRSDFTWRTNFNVSYNKNTVLKLGFDNTPIPQGFSNLTNIIQVGSPINSMMLYSHVGVFMNADDLAKYPKMSTMKVGDSRYADTNGDGVITAADRSIVGQPTPDFTYGLTNDFKYKRFDLRIVAFAQTGGSIYSMIGRSIDRPTMGYLYNKLAIWKDRWQSVDKPGNGWVPNMNASTGGFYDTRWLYSSDYLRIKNITLGYDAPKIKGFQSLRLYLSLENAFIWHKYYGGLSPEALNNEGGDYGGYPQAKVLTLGVQAGF
ncbi:MAG: TonB-dependent receptor [Saprospiraceae bacterium]|nr:TonB-dependent receptor [Saprospiraceae bacterium]